MSHFEFKDPLVLILIPIATLFLYFYQRRRKEGSLRFSSSQLVEGLPFSWKIWAQASLYWWRALVIILFLIALAGPRMVSSQTKHQTEGIDILLAIDISGSMAAEDFVVGAQRVNRLDITKSVVKEFIEKRQEDRVGIIAFAGLAYTVCPLTSDNKWLKENLDRLELGIIQDGTAIGSAIASSVSRLKDSQAKSRIIVLLTDGVNNAGSVDPISAAKAAKSFGLKIYVVGVGTKGYAPYPMVDMFGRRVYQNVQIEIDEDVLREIATVTNGQYFRATDTDSLRKIYDEIDKLEKSKVEEIGYKEYTELFIYVLAVALILLIAEILLSRTVLLRIP